MNAVPTWAVIPSNGRSFLKECLDSLAPQVDGIVIVANGSDPIVFKTGFPEKTFFVRDSGSDMNISRWWNLGLGFAQTRIESEQWNVLVVNDDIVAPPHLVRTLSTELRSSPAVLAYPNQHDNHRILWTDPRPVSLFHRITGFCYMLRGESGLRLDESLVWWYGDDDLDWRARQTGGSLLVPGCAVTHHAPNGSMLDHPELHVQAGKDRETFLKKWGKTPW